MNLFLRLALAGAALASSSPASAQNESALALGIDTPASRIVYQRNRENHAAIPVRGTCPIKATRVEARLVPHGAGAGTATEWMTVDAAPVGGKFHGSLPGTGGWYDLEVRASAAETVLATTIRERVGVGEVFIIVGHSVAAGQRVNLDGATDERVITVPLDKKGAEYQAYLQDADPRHLPDGFAPYGNDVQPAPNGEGTYFWARFGEILARRENVPVLIYNAAFGGTSLEHWSLSAQGIPFDHSFVKSGLRMPYINLRNTLTKYIPVTGVRAILADQGANDWPQKDENIVFDYYESWVNKARADLGHPTLAIVVNRHTPFQRDIAIRHAQERMIATPACFAGPDYDRFAPEDRPDMIHLGLSGETKAAAWWAEALNADFFKRSDPWLPSWK